MLVHTKKLPIRAKNQITKSLVEKKIQKNMTFFVSCPPSNALLIMQYLKENGCIYEELTEVKGLFTERTSANMLIGARGKESITQKQLSELTGIPKKHISDMENGRRSIGKQNALKLGKALNINYQLFL